MRESYANTFAATSDELLDNLGITGRFSSLRKKLTAAYKKLAYELQEEGADVLLLAMLQHLTGGKIPHNSPQSSINEWPTNKFDTTELGSDALHLSVYESRPDHGSRSGRAVVVYSHAHNNRTPLSSAVVQVASPVVVNKLREECGFGERVIGYEAHIGSDRADSI